MEPRQVASVRGASNPAGPLRALPAGPRPAHRPVLPGRQTSFVGRTSDLAELTELLTVPDCRLVTIIGPGGIGKTRLAVEAATAVRERFADGVAFAPLQAVSDAGSLPTALAAALGYALSGREDAREQVARYLRPAHLLLVLDNLEHLLTEAVWLGDLLATAPGLRLLVTSRQALNLQEEWRYPLAG
ncbi:MAG TPA: AAA family ATPase, partial [Thermomicrobiales bacterium]